jgi:D-inositol-3-phosphate glycosyltransferase
LSARYHLLQCRTTVKILPSAPFISEATSGQLRPSCGRLTEVPKRVRLEQESESGASETLAQKKTMVATLSEEIPGKTASAIPAAVAIALMTGGVDRPYALGLAMAVAARNVHVDVIGNDAVDSIEMHTTPNLRFFNLWPARSAKATSFAKVSRTLSHYKSLVCYAAVARPHIFHILWNSKIQVFDRTLLMLYYKMMRKRIALTAHNVNQAKRDSRDTWLNRATLRIQYHLADHVFVHTQKMKNELMENFGVEGGSITVIRHPINNAFPETELTTSEAKSRLGLWGADKTILCFGRIKPYKGIEYLLSAFRALAAKDDRYRLIIAGEVQKGNERYMDSLVQAIALEIDNGQVILRTEFIPDEDMEVYLKAADVLVLPYKDIFQSGVLFLGYSFGLPVIVTDVGSFREEVVEGETGYICRPGDPEDLARAIETYFTSDLYRNLEMKREEIKNYADIHHSWDAVADLTRKAYEGMLGS